MGKEGRRSERLGIISQKEHELLQRAKKKDALIKERERLRSKKEKLDKDVKRISEINKELNDISTRLTELVKNLDKRINALGENLRNILKSAPLAPFVRTRARIFFNIPPIYEGKIDSYSAITAFTELNAPIFRDYDGTEAIPDYSTWKVEWVKERDRKYWLNTNVESKLTIENIFQPEYSIKGIKGAWRRTKKESGKKIKEIVNVRDILKEALDVEKRFQNRIKSKELPLILPKTKDKAESIDQILKNITNFKNEKRRKDSTIKVRPITNKDMEKIRIEKDFEKVFDYMKENFSIKKKKEMIKTLIN